MPGTFGGGGLRGPLPIGPRLHVAPLPGCRTVVLQDISPTGQQSYKSVGLLFHEILQGMYSQHEKYFIKSAIIASLGATYISIEAKLIPEFVFFGLVRCFSVKIE